jgi:hypothetical protein
MIKLTKILLLGAVLLHASTLSAGSDFESPTQKHLEIHTMDEIKYNFRLDNITLIYKDLFDKLVPNESEGFIGYHGDSLEYRIYQDVIKIVLEEIVGIDTPIDFHYLDIPCFRDQKIRELADIPQFFLPEKKLSIPIERQLFPINIALYANHNCIGFSSVLHFTGNIPTIKHQFLEKDLKEFFQRLGMNPCLVDDAFSIGTSQLKDDRGILLQIYDHSEEYYSFANRNCYPSYPNGYPFANRIVSEYYYQEDAADYPTELKLLLTDQHSLNPDAPLTIKRFDKIQPAIVKNYEATLRGLIQKADYDSVKVEEYYQKLINAWKH